MTNHPSHQPQPYSERARLAQLIGDARRLLATPTSGVATWARRTAALESVLGQLADSAETVLSQPAQIRQATAGFEDDDPTGPGRVMPGGGWVSGPMLSPAPRHTFVAPGQVSPGRPAPDACMECGQPEATHRP